MEETPSYLSVLHNGVDVSVGDGGVLAAKHLVGSKPQGVQQLLLAKLRQNKSTHNTRERGRGKIERVRDERQRGKEGERKRERESETERYTLLIIDRDRP